MATSVNNSKISQLVHMKLAACRPTLLASHTALSTTMAPTWLQNLQLAVIAISSLIYCSCLMMLFIGIYVYGSIWELISVATSTCAVHAIDHNNA